MINRAICAARAAWYSTEAGELRRARKAAWLPPWKAWRDPPGWHYQGGYYPRVTAYIPTHNRADILLERALPSIFKQTYPNLEIIVAAHGCTDGTAERAAEYCRANQLRVVEPESFWDGEWVARYSRASRVLRVLRTPTYPPTAENHWLAGPVVPANAALKAARGQWIARIDDDDTWEPGHVEKLLRFAQKGNYEFVSSAYRTHKGVVHHDGESPPIGGVQTWLYRSYLSFMRYNPDCWRKTHNRVNDTDLADRFRKAGVRIGHLDEVTASVLPRPGEEMIGLKAYTRDRANKEKQFAF